MYTYSAELIKVIDGDTIDVNIDLGFGVWLRNQRVRLHSIDAPESRTSNKEEKVRGELSKTKLKEILTEKLLITTYINDDEKFGRVLAKIVNDKGIWVNEWLVEHNYAVVYDGTFSKELLQESHAKNAAILKERGEI